MKIIIKSMKFMKIQKKLEKETLYKDDQILDV
jgi:hypothetical protein